MNHMKNIKNTFHLSFRKINAVMAKVSKIV